MSQRRPSGYCPKCGTWRYSLHRDHVVPKFKGGSDDESNVQYICANCHEDKSREERTGDSTIARKTWGTRRARGHDHPSRAAVEKRLATMRANGTFQIMGKRTAQIKKESGADKRGGAKSIMTRRERNVMPESAKRGWTTRRERVDVSESAKQGWVTRRERGSRPGGGTSESAKRAWETRRQKMETTK